MEDYSDSASELTVSRSLLKELVQLRSLRVDKEMLAKTNQCYVSQLSQLEVKISEFKAIAKAREVEIGTLKEKLVSRDSEQSYRSEIRSICELEAKLALLEEENEQMKDHALLRVDNEQLKLELLHATLVRDAFEEKFIAAKVELLGLLGNLEITRPSPRLYENIPLFEQKLKEADCRLATIEEELDKERGQVVELQQRLVEGEAVRLTLDTELGELKGRLAAAEAKLSGSQTAESKAIGVTNRDLSANCEPISPILETPCRKTNTPLCCQVNLSEEIVEAPAKQLSEANPNPNPAQATPSPSGKISSNKLVSKAKRIKSKAQTPALYFPSYLRYRRTTTHSIPKLGSAYAFKTKKHLRLELSASDNEQDEERKLSIQTEQ